MISIAAKLILMVVVVTSALSLLTRDAHAGDAAAGLAVAGPCAEPRDAIAGVGDPSFSVVGPLQSLLSPVDVAAGPSTVSPPPPPAMRERPRPGACDQPGSGCGEVLPPTRVIGNPVARIGPLPPF